MRLDFLEPTGEHLPTLRYLLNSYIAGDITSVDGIISLRERAAVSGGKKPGTQAGIGKMVGAQPEDSRHGRCQPRPCRHRCQSRL